MKVTVTKEENMFKPVTFSITCENADELYALWHRFNLDQSHVMVFSKETENRVPNGLIDVDTVRVAIDKEIRKLRYNFS